MSNDPYKTPETSKLETVQRMDKVPLSQAPGRKKLIIGIPASIVFVVLAYIGIAPGITRMVSVIFGAYALVGFIEVIGGESLIASAKKWDSLPGWKKFVISTAVIVAAIVGFIGLMPMVAKYF